ncbi:class I SAM-dependent methyltransferase [Propionicimonas sp.]|uniref:class I SAM-dependent methyltransferase n=1 Tax=Propionicimonas sp. TaxID=1955623 RepID=UPI0039E27C3C
MTYPLGQWQQIIARDPGHSTRYVERFRMLAAQGHDLYGEARLIDAMVGRESAILDAGCGPGRHAGYLAEAGHRVVGVDVDPTLIAAARADSPGPLYVVADLAGLTLPPEAPAAFDAILCAGNVMGFLHPATRVPVLAGFASLLAPTGRAVVGFGAGRGYAFDDFAEDAAAAGLAVESRFSTWDLRPFTADAGFLVAVLTRP